MQPQRRQPTRLPRPWDSPGMNTRVGCHFLLQCMKVKSESEVAQSRPTVSDPMDYSPPGSSIHGIFQARVLEIVLSKYRTIKIQELYTHGTSLPGRKWTPRLWVDASQGWAPMSLGCIDDPLLDLAVGKHWTTLPWLYLLTLNLKKAAPMLWLYLVAERPTCPLTEFDSDFS